MKTAPQARPVRPEARSKHKAHSADTTPLGAATTAGDSTSDREVRDVPAPGKPGQPMRSRQGRRLLVGRQTTTDTGRAGGDAGSSACPRGLTAST